jgi:hypothetical protein
MMAEDELKAVKKTIEELDNLCKTFERSLGYDMNNVTYQSWQKRLAALRKNKNLLMAQQQAAGMLS